jgi:gliding motility-associated-like protein
LNPNIMVRGQWIYDLKVTADAGISGNTVNGTYTSATNLTETLTNSDNIIHKVVYRFIPRIVPDDGGSDCVNGIEKSITIWVYPSLTYTKEISDYNGFNVSCYGKSNGYIRLNPTSDLAPLSFSWTGPGGFKAATKDISGLIAGQYNVLIIDKNMCTTNDSFVLTEPKKLSMTIKPSISLDGAYNINCAGENGGSITVSAINNVGLVDYLWIDGNKENIRTNLSAGIYKVVITDSNSCQADSTVTLTEPDLLNISFDITQPFCPDKPDGEIRLTVTGGIAGNDYMYNWSNSSSDKNNSNILPGLYRVTVSDQNRCSKTDSIQLKPENQICLIIPEAFSPNGDLINDVWNIGNIDLYPQAVVMVYNRWGQALWRSDRGYPQPWDGKSKGHLLPLESYHYAIDLNNGSKVFVGTITIVR